MATLIVQSLNHHSKTALWSEWIEPLGRHELGQREGYVNVLNMNNCWSENGLGGWDKECAERRGQEVGFVIHSTRTQDYAGSTLETNTEV